MIKALLLLAALIVPAFSQSVPVPVIQGQFLGQDDLDPSLSIGNEAQSALNVETSLNGSALLKRSGYSRTASLSISTSPATGVYAFIDPNGNKQQIVCSDHYCAKSTNNTAFSVFLSTAGGNCLPTRWQFAQISGYLYGVNDCYDTPWRYDGTTRVDISSSPPHGSIIEATKDRLVISGLTADPGGIYYSQSGTPTNFTVGINSADPYIDENGAQGDRVRALKYALGRLFVFKTNSITSCILGDQYTSKCFPVSNTVGTSDPLSVVEVPGSYAQNGVMTSGAILFRGSDLNYWQLDQTGLNVISRKISNLVSSQTAGSNQSNTQNNQSSWNAGTMFPLVSVSSPVWNTTTISGSIFPSSNTVGDNTTAAFSSGTTFTNISTTDFVNGISLASTTYADTWATTTAGVLGWTIGPLSSFAELTPGVEAAGNVTGHPVLGAGNLLDTSSPTFVNGDWKFSHSYQQAPSNVCGSGNNNACFEFRFIKNGSNYYAVSMNDNASYTKTVSILKVVSGVATTLGTTTYATYLPNTAYNWEVSRNADGSMYLSIGGVLLSTCAADTSISSSGGVEIGSWVGNSFFNFSAYSYNTPGKFISRTLDTLFTSPTWGPFSSTFTVALNNINGQVDFYTQTSNDGVTWDAKLASSDTLKITSSQKRYGRYEADLSTVISTYTPVINSAFLGAATTGQYAIQCIQPGSNITAWGIMSCAQTLAGGGSEVFYATSAATCGSLPTGAPNTWQTSVSNNATLSISTNAAVYLGFRSLLTSSTDQAQINACTIFWANGTPAAPSWGTYDPIKNAAYWTTAINNSATANRVLKYDLNLNEWYPFGMNATAIFRDQNSNSIYFGDSAAGYWNKYGGVTSDNGAAINAYWQGRDIGSQSGPFVDNSFNRISIAAKNQVTGSMTLTYNLSNNTSNSYNVSLSTTSGIVYLHGNYNILKASPFQFINVQLGNNSITPFEVDALSLDMNSMGWRAQNP